MNKDKQTLDYLRHELEWAYYRQNEAFNDGEVFLAEQAVESLKHAIEKIERYDKMAKCIAESGFTCEHMPIGNPWCEKHCSEEKPDTECAEQWLDWSEKNE